MLLPRSILIDQVTFLLFALGATQTVVRPAGDAIEGDPAYQVMVRSLS